MMGRSRGFAADSEDGLRRWSEVYDAERTAPALRALPGRRSDESRRKKKLRKLKKKAQRWNRK